MKGKSRLPIFLARAAVFIGAAGLAIILAEVAVRLFAPLEELFPQWQWDAVPDNSEGIYTTDEDLGFRPVLGAGEYSEFGTVLNDYPVKKTPGVTRLLFLGDSVTHRWRIQKPLVQRCLTTPVEFWNAGVEGFNAGQEVEYYLRWNHRIEPDHVTLVFHNNDFVATPVAFRNDDGQVVVANPRAYLSKTNVALAGRSHIYRHYLKWRITRMMRDDPVTSARETRAALAKLKGELEANGIGFNVILMPILKPLEEWTDYETRSREISLEILGDLEIAFYDLVPPLVAAAAKGIELHETPGDIWHPSEPVARRFARHLIRRGYLESVLGPGGCGPNPSTAARPEATDP